MDCGHVATYDHLDIREDIWEEHNKQAIIEIATKLIEKYNIPRSKIVSCGLHKCKRQLIERVAHA